MPYSKQTRKTTPSTPVLTDSFINLPALPAHPASDVCAVVPTGPEEGDCRREYTRRHTRHWERRRLNILPGVDDPAKLPETAWEWEGVRRGLNHILLSQTLGRPLIRRLAGIIPGCWWCPLGQFWHPYPGFLPLRERERNPKQRQQQKIKKDRENHNKSKPNRGNYQGHSTRMKWVCIYSRKARGRMADRGKLNTKI